MLSRTARPFAVALVVCFWAASAHAAVVATLAVMDEGTDATRSISSPNAVALGSVQAFELTVDAPGPDATAANPYVGIDRRLDALASTAGGPVVRALTFDTIVPEPTGPAGLLVATCVLLGRRRRA